MAGPQVERIVAHYGTLLERWLDRYGRVVNEGRNGTYSADDWTSDMVASWSDLASCWSFAAGLLDPPVSVPDVVIEIAPGEVQRVEAVPIADPGSITLESTDLRDNGNLIAANNVQAWLSADRRILVVRLRRMDQDPPLGVLQPGREFRGDIHEQGHAANVKARLVVRVR